jgi:hypothetical protein
MRRGVVLAVAAGLALAGCGDVSPGAAATVDGTRIQMEEVDDLAGAWCTYLITYADVNEQPWQPQPSATYRDQVLTQLIQLELAEEVAEELHVDVPPSRYQTPEDPQTRPIIDAMPADQQEPFRRLVDLYGKVQATDIAIDVSRGGDEPTTPDEAQQAAAEGQKYVSDFAEDRDIDLDPRFGEFTAGQVSGGSGSLSVSADVGDEQEAPDDATDVSGLPESQICQ